MSWKEVGIRLGLLVLVGGVIVGLFALTQARSDRDIVNNLQLINPPQEVLEGRVEKIVTETVLYLGSETEETTATIFLCSGQTWTPTQNQVDTVITYLKYLAPHKGCGD